MTTSRYNLLDQAGEARLRSWFTTTEVPFVKAVPDLQGATVTEFPAALFVIEWPARVKQIISIMSGVMTAEYEVSFAVDLLVAGASDATLDEYPVREMLEKLRPAFMGWFPDLGQGINVINGSVPTGEKIFQLATGMSGIETNWNLTWKVKERINP